MLQFGLKNLHHSDIIISQLNPPKLRPLGRGMASKPYKVLTPSFSNPCTVVSRKRYGHRKVPAGGGLCVNPTPSNLNFFMAWRLKKSISLGKFAKINLSKSGIGMSVGVKGLRTGISSKGKSYTTIGIPGTGLSNTTYHNSKSKEGNASLSGVPPTKNNNSHNPNNFMSDNTSNPKKPIYKKWWFWVIVILVLIFMASGGDDQPQNDGSSQSDQAKSEQTAEPEETAIQISATDLYAAFDANEISADSAYEGKLVEVSGRVNNVGKDILDDEYIMLKSGTLIGGVQCMLESNAVEQASTLSEDDEVTLRGRVSSGSSLTVLVRGCTFVEVEG